eukprot:5352535-Prymnesium_polylepis.1
MSRAAGSNPSRFWCSMPQGSASVGRGASVVSFQQRIRVSQSCTRDAQRISGSASGRRSARADSSDSRAAHFRRQLRATRPSGPKASPVRPTVWRRCASSTGAGRHCACSRSC